MPVSPELAADAAKEILQAYLDAELQVLQQVARRLDQGITADGWAEDKLREVQTVKTSIGKVVLELQTGDPERIRKAIHQAYNRGSATAATDLTKVGASIQTAFGTSNLATVEALAVEATGRLSQLYGPILRQTMDAYREVIASTTQLVATGAGTRRQAAQAALDGLAKRGITGFVDSAGRRWSLPAYAEMATRTAANRAVLAGHTERLTSYGVDLVIVSDSPQECPLCRPFERQVLSITGRTREAEDGTRVKASLSEAMAAGLFHPACTHSTAAYVPGLTRPKTEGTDNPEGYGARQELRRLERGVRSWKRRKAVAITPDARRKADAKVGEWRDRIKTHTAGTEAKRVRAREQIGRAR